MSELSLTQNLFLVLIVLTSTILISILAYFTIRLAANRSRNRACQILESKPAVIDPESGRESRLSHRLSRQQSQQEHYQGLQQRYSPAPPSPSIELLPEITTSSSDDKADEWLERGVADEGINVVHGDLGQKTAEMTQAMVIKPKKQLRWDRREEDRDNGSEHATVIERTDKDGMVCTEYRAG